MAAPTVATMTSAERPGAAVVRELRAAPTSYVLGPLAFIGLGWWLMATSSATWLALLLLVTGVSLLVSGLASAVVAATGYAGPGWWQRATGHAPRSAAGGQDGPTSA